MIINCSSNNNEIVLSITENWLGVVVHNSTTYIPAQQITLEYKVRVNDHYNPYIRVNVITSLNSL